MPPENQKKSKFKIPYINASYWVGLALILSLYLYLPSSEAWLNYWNAHWSGESRADHFLMSAFFLIWLFIAYFSITKRLSLIPVLGLLVNLYLMTQMGATNWERFMYWCIAGFIIYFSYSYRKSKLQA